ncbi:hypothetical protein F5X98DRAFT_349232 [Xylaria grammica]|nr:hypothetical protein F5X98DRAFT_349232 [Xylaria grammica]
MAGPLPDFDFSDALQDIPGSMGDDLFSGAKSFVDNDPFLDTNFGDIDPILDANFGDDIDPKFEERLAEDYPAEKVEASEVPVLPAQQPEEPSSHPLKASNNINTQFINPQQLWVNQPANTLSIPNFNNLDIQQRSDGLFTQDPIFYNQPYGNQAYAQYFPMGSRQQILQQPMGIQMTDEPIVYGQRVMSGQPIVQPPIVQQPMIQQPVFPQHRGTQISGQQIIYHRPTNPTYQVPRSRLHQPPQPTPRAVSQRSSKEKVIEPTRSSFIPTPLYRSHYSKRLPSPGTVTTRPPPKRPARNHYGELLLNDKIPRRTHGNKGNDNVEPERYYGPPTKKPDDWGPCDENGRHLFTYTDKGELAAGAFFTTRQMRHFLLGPGPGETFKAPNRQLGVKRTPKKARDGLTLWIGWPAAMANSRYPRGGESTKCRFKNCLYEHTISVGEPWVIFDERQNVDGELYNPFYNSGYCHLYCLESHFDIIHLWHLIDIRADYRSFKRESHPYFSLDYKLTGIGDELKAWWLAEYEIWAQLKSLGQRRSRTIYGK